MSRRNTVALSLLLLGTAVATAQNADPPGTAAFMGQYRAWFAGTDTSKDGMLDKQELAIRFRGAAAKPYDYVAPGKEKPDEIKGESEKPTETKPAPKVNYTAYADYNFLAQLDKNGDEQLSRDEFEAWARDLALQAKNQLEAQARLLQQQQKLASLALPKKPTANDRRKFDDDKRRIEANLKKEREENERLKDRLERAQKNFKQAQQRQAEQKKQEQKKQEQKKKEQQKKQAQQKKK